MRRLLSKLLPRSKKRQEPADLMELTRLARRYTVERQQVPRNLHDLVALKYLKAVPEAPAGHRFVIDRTRVEVRLESASASGEGENSKSTSTDASAGSV